MGIHMGIHIGISKRNFIHYEIHSFSLSRQHSTDQSITEVSFTFENKTSAADAVIVGFVPEGQQDRSWRPSQSQLWHSCNNTHTVQWRRTPLTTGFVTCWCWLTIVLSHWVHIIYDVSFYNSTASSHWSHFSKLHGQFFLDILIQ